MIEHMFETLESAIEALVILADPEAVAAAHDLADRLAAKLNAAVGALEVAGGWDAGGAVSMTSWLRHATRQSNRDAARAAITARRLRQLPVTRAAWVEGRLSGGQVQAVLANLNARTIGVFAAQEAELVSALVPLGVADTATVARAWAARAEALCDEPEPDPDPPRRSLHLAETLAGRGELEASLDPEGSAVVRTALRLAESPDGGGEPPRPAAQRRADALVDVCRFFLDHQGRRVGRRHRPHLNVVVDVDALAGGGAGQVLDGPVLDGATVGRLACDAGLHRVLTQGRSTILDYGATTRTAPANLWAALVVRDGHCRHPGCDRGPEWCEAHHIPPFPRGPTSIDSMVLKCSRHHHLAHLKGWSEKLLPDGTLEVTTPRGLVLSSRPPPRGPDGSR
jgi:hypothetical protein